MKFSVCVCKSRDQVQQQNKTKQNKTQLRSSFLLPAKQVQLEQKQYRMVPRAASSSVCCEFSNCLAHHLHWLPKIRLSCIICILIIFIIPHASSEQQQQQPLAVAVAASASAVVNNHAILVPRVTLRGVTLEASRYERSPTTMAANGNQQQLYFSAGPSGFETGTTLTRAQQHQEALSILKAPPHRFRTGQQTRDATAFIPTQTLNSKGKIRAASLSEQEEQQLVSSSSSLHQGIISTQAQSQPNTSQQQQQSPGVHLTPEELTWRSAQTGETPNGNGNRNGFIGDSNSLFSEQQLELDQKCQKRSLTKMLKNAKNLLTNGFNSLERSTTASNLMLGSSILAAAIPFVVYALPIGLGSSSEFLRQNNGKRRDSTNNIDGFSGSSSKLFSLQGRVDSFMGWIERSVEHLPNFPRLHPQECVKRSICEAHNEPDKYGAIGFMLRFLFPATNLNVTDRMDNMEYKVINKYRHAAGYGLARRMESSASENGTFFAPTGSCREKYEDCLVSLLEVAQNLVDLFLH